MNFQGRISGQQRTGYTQLLCCIGGRQVKATPSLPKLEILHPSLWSTISLVQDKVSLYGFVSAAVAVL